MQEIYTSSAHRWMRCGELGMCSASTVSSAYTNGFCFNWIFAFPICKYCLRHAQKCTYESVTIDESTMELVYFFFDMWYMISIQTLTKKWHLCFEMPLEVEDHLCGMITHSNMGSRGVGTDRRRRPAKTPAAKKPQAPTAAMAIIAKLDVPSNIS